MTGSANQCLTRANRAKFNTTCNYLSLILIALACDVELNPGPEYPCGMCNQEVSWSHHGVCCDSCDAWFHASCQNINSTVYEALNNTNCSWVCFQCGMPNFSSGLFSFNYLETENTYAPLNQEDSESSMDLPSSPPQITSTPKKDNQKQGTSNKDNVNRGLKTLRQDKTSNVGVSVIKKVNSKLS